ncbi:hypothetical protein BH23CHL5_BH23CHL5_23830 [soil metagenome]
MSDPGLLDDRIATVAACTWLGAIELGEDGFSPMAPSEWNRVAQCLHNAGLRPRHLLASEVETSPEIWNELSEVERQKVLGLRKRAGVVALELERLEQRGIWARARSDEDYPSNIRHKLKNLAAPVLFGSGPSTLPNRKGIAIVGSREIGQDLIEVADRMGRLVSRSGLVVVSGGARGTDRIGMNGALERGGQVVGVLSGSLDRLSRGRDVAPYIVEGALCLLSHVHPTAGFSVGTAMARNKLIHSLSDATIVISTANGTGWTWAGSMDNLKRGWSPVLVWTGDGAPEANHALVGKGGFGFAEIPEDTDGFEALIESAQNHATERADNERKATQQSLFP